MHNTMDINFDGYKTTANFNKEVMNDRTNMYHTTYNNDTRYQSRIKNEDFNSKELSTPLLGMNSNLSEDNLCLNLVNDKNNNDSPSSQEEQDKTVRLDRSREEQSKHDNDPSEKQFDNTQQNSRTKIINNSNGKVEETNHFDIEKLDSSSILSNIQNYQVFQQKNKEIEVLPQNNFEELEFKYSQDDATPELFHRISSSNFGDISEGVEIHKINSSLNYNDSKKLIKEKGSPLLK